MTSRTSRPVVAVAMSGGADSTATLALLKQSGMDVFGVTALMTRESSRCCAPADVERAAAAAAELGVPHHRVEVFEAFETDVVAYFVSEYVAGRTPSPCVVCNRRIKFGALLEAAVRLGADKLATGHYARVGNGEGGQPRLYRAADRRKDQSYFLARLDRAQLGRALFPLGTMLKPDVLAFLGRMGLPGGERGESQDVCFVPDGDHGRWIDLRALNTPPPGEIVTTDGRVIGRHDGIHHYTVGQRKGLGIATGRPMYVVRISPEANRVVVGPVEEARQDRIRAEDVSWISRTPPSREFDASVQIRYRHAPAAARVTICAGGAAEIEFREPQFGVAPGQSAAIFKDDEVLGAGWIAGN